MLFVNALLQIVSEAQQQHDGEIIGVDREDGDDVDDGDGLSNAAYFRFQLENNCQSARPLKWIRKAGFIRRSATEIFSICRWSVPNESLICAQFSTTRRFVFFLAVRCLQFFQFEFDLHCRVLLFNGACLYLSTVPGSRCF